MAPWASIALTTTTAALLALPVAPALFELRKRGDAAPLPTSRHDARIDNFAEVFHSRLEPLLPQLERCRTKRELSRTSIGEMTVLLVGRHPFDFDPILMQGVAAVMCSQAALVPAGRVVEADVYAGGVLELGEGAALRAALGAGDIILAKDSAVLRWLHAHGSAYLRRGSSVYGRLSAAHSIHLERGCGFQRMHAPQIFTADLDQEDADSDRAVIPSRTHICQSNEDAGHVASDTDDAFAPSRPRIRVQGNFVLASGETLNANVVATGEVRIGPGARLFGSAKSYKDTVIEETACVHGSIICEGNLRLETRSFVAGPVIAEGDVLMTRGSCVGGPDTLTTMSSSNAKISTGCLLHGTVWARERGNVEG